MDNLQRRDNGSIRTSAKNIDRAAAGAPPVIVSDAPMTQAHVRVPDSVDRPEWLKLRSRRRSDRRRASSASSTHPTLGAIPPSHSRKMSMDSTTSSLATEASLRSAMSTPLHRGQNDERVRRSVTFAVDDHDRRRPSLDSNPRRRTASSAGRKIFPSSSSSSPSSLASSQQQQCGVCRAEFTRYRRPHRCRACSKVVCATCSPARLPKRTCKPCAGDSAIPRVFSVVSPARGRVSPHAPGEETTSATRASRRCVGATVMAGVPADTGVIVTAVAHEAEVVGVARAEEVGRAGTEEGSSSLGVAGNVRLGGSVSEDRVGKGKPENPRSSGGKGGLGVDSVGESEPGGSSSLRNTSQGGEVWRSNGIVGVAGDQHAEHLDSLDGTNSNTDGCGSATRVEFDTHLSPTASLNDYPPAGLDGLPPPTATPGLNTYRYVATVATAGTGARQAWVVADGGSKPRDERTVSPASGEEVKPEEEDEEDRVSIATRNEVGSAVPEVEDEPEVRQAPVPAALLHPPPAAASLATEPRCGQPHLPLEANEATRETPPPSVEFERGTEIARVPNPRNREERDGVVSTPLRHRGPLEEDSRIIAKREEDEEKEGEEAEAEAEVEEEEGEKEEGGGGGEEEVLEEDVSGQQHETTGAVETTEEDLRFTVGRVNDGPEGGKGVSDAAARLNAEKRCGEEVTDPGTADVPFVLPKYHEGEGDLAEGDCAEGLSVDREEGECDREALVLGAGVAVDGRVKEEPVQENSGPMGPLATAAMPQGKPQQQQREQQEEEYGEGEGEGEKEVEEDGGERGEGGKEVEVEEETDRDTETVLVLGTDMAVDDRVKEGPVEEDSGPMDPLVSAPAPQRKQQEQEQEQQDEEQEKEQQDDEQEQEQQDEEEQQQEGEKKVEEEENEEEEGGGREQEQQEQEEGEGGEEKEEGDGEEAEEEQEDQEGGVDEEGASVDGEAVAVGDNTLAATSAGTMTDSPVNDQLAGQKTPGLPGALPISHEGGGRTDDENVGEDGVEEGEEASTVGVGDAMAGPGSATDSFSTTALVSAEEGGTAEDVGGEASCSHDAGTKALDTAIDSIAQAPDCKEGATQDDDVGEKAAAAEGEGPCNYKESSDALGLLVDAAGITQHEQEEREPQEAEENPAPSCGTAAGTASENNGRGNTVAAGSGGVEGATVDAPMGRVDETAPTMRSDSEAIDSSRADRRGSTREASGGYADGGRHKSNWLAALKELVEKGGSCCH
ncbi:unnamed protein product [Ectocarpus sp. CCAP 1310/34]|nr:unnamed protein product [Ectocarpus sp. CCAP 1310/34]